jgi:hypothetical protein
MTSLHHVKRLLTIWALAAFSVPGSLCSDHTTCTAGADDRTSRGLVEHYKDNTNGIGWQIDNETSAYGASNPDVFAGFVEHLTHKFGTTDNQQRRGF